MLRKGVRLCDLQKSVFDGFLAGGRACEKEGVDTDRMVCRRVSRPSRTTTRTSREGEGQIGCGCVGLVESSGQYYSSSSRTFNLGIPGSSFRAPGVGTGAVVG